MLVDGIPDEQARWKQDPDTWSILEVVSHLYDEEREDFRVRLDIILHKPDQTWPPIDPAGWVKERRYNERDMEGSLEGFLAERRDSLEWLKALNSPNWDAAYETSFGKIRAGDMFASWVAHDQMHMRQLIELHRAHTLLIIDPYGSEYAGQW